MSRPVDKRAASTHGTTTNTVTIRGGTVTGSVIGAGNVTTGHVGGGAQPPTVADLSARVAALRDEIVAAGATAEARDKLAYELREMLDTLSQKQPDPAPVKTRWSAVQKLLGGVAAAGTAAATAVKEITDLITAVFGGN
jgi:hypothetical protein